MLGLSSTTRASEEETTVSYYPPNCDPCSEDTTTTSSTVSITTTTTPLADTGGNVGDVGLIAAVTLSVGFVGWLITRRWERQT